MRHPLLLPLLALAAAAAPARAAGGGLAPALQGYYLEAAGDREGAVTALREAVAADPLESLGGYSELPRELKPVSDAPIADAPVVAMPEYVDSGAKPGASHPR